VVTDDPWIKRQRLVNQLRAFGWRVYTEAGSDDALAVKLGQHVRRETLEDLHQTIIGKQIPLGRAQAE
jgi:hypothetical protein